MLSGFLQYPVSFGDPAANFNKIRDAVGSAEFDLLVMPELCTIGYFHDSREALSFHAESALDGPTAEFLLQLSAEKNATLIAGIAECDDDRIYNTAIVVSRGRWLGKQRKCHLSRIEKLLFTPGDSLACFDDGACRFGVLTCFDLWMPEAARLLVHQGAQLLCCPANYGGPWTTRLARIRAMENATPLICANRTGGEMYAGAEATFRGESQIVGPMGEVWTSATAETSLGVSVIDPAAYVLKANPMCDDLMEEASRYALSGPHPK
jgi:omega-amidase